MVIECIIVALLSEQAGTRTQFSRTEITKKELTLIIKMEVKAYLCLLQ